MQNVPALQQSVAQVNIPTTNCNASSQCRRGEQYPERYDEGVTLAALDAALGL